MEPETNRELEIFECQVRRRVAFKAALIEELRTKYQWTLEEANELVEKVWAEVRAERENPSNL